MLTGKGEDCGDKVVDALKTLNIELTGEAETKLRTQWRKIMKTVYDDIVQNALVEVKNIQAGSQTVQAEIK